MESDYFLKVTEDALRTVYERDIDLIGPKANERAVAHRLAVYLEPSFEGMNVDCEYNWYGEELGPKQLPGIGNCSEGKETDWIVPDILIHARKSKDEGNLAVFEIKSGSKLDDCDKLKLEGMTSKNGRFRYDYGVGVEFYTDHCDRLMFVDGKQLGELMRLDASQWKATEGSSSAGAEGGLAARSRGAMEERANAIRLENEAKSRIEGLSPEMAVERYNYLKGRSITELTEAEYAERLVLAEKLSEILKDKRKQKS
jgi:hypothetical protein